MTIQIYALIWFGGNEEKVITDYFDNEKEAQEKWNKLFDRYEKANCKAEMYAIKNNENNVRPEKRYGASPIIKGQTIGQAVIGNYA